MSRYAVRLVPGAPSRDIAIGVTMSKSGGVSGAGSGGGAGGSASAGAVGLYWSSYPHRNAGDDVLQLKRLSSLNALGVETTPPLCAVNHVLWGWEAWRGIVSAYLENVPDGAAIEWSISEPSIAPSYTWNDVAYTAPGGPILVKVAANEVLHVVASGRMAQFRLVAPSNWEVPEWVLSPITVSATVDGTPTRTLTLYVSGEAWNYDPGPIE